MTGKPLFVYGTLRDPEVLGALLGRAVTAPHPIEAHAPGFRAVHYPQRIYPALIAAADANAPGLLLGSLTPIELAILDAFEGDEYRRATLAVLAPSGMVDAEVYLPVVIIPPDAAHWTLHDWTLHHKEAVIDGERRTAAALHDRFSAARKP